MTAREPFSARSAAARRTSGRAKAGPIAFLQFSLPFFAPHQGSAEETTAPALPTAIPTVPAGVAQDPVVEPLPAVVAPAPAVVAPALSDVPPGSTDAALDRLWRDSAPGWSNRWGVADLRGTVRVELSHRMRSSLGGFYPRERLIRIADTLLEAPPHLLHEVLCHEAAHAAVHVLHGDRARSHGREWRELMRAVGLEPRVRIPRQEIGPAAQRAARKRWVWRHRCPVCRAQRLAGRPVRQWRCGPCRALGRDGKLAISRVAARAVQAPP